jgi:hypothetical protein
MDRLAGHGAAGEGCHGKHASDKVSAMEDHGWSPLWLPEPILCTRIEQPSVLFLS